jgi:hypothetical protein
MPQARLGRLCLLANLDKLLHCPGAASTPYTNATGCHCHSWQSTGSSRSSPPGNRPGTAPRYCSPSLPGPERRFGRLSALRTHTKAPSEMDFHSETLRALNRPGAARTVRRVRRTGRVRRTTLPRRGHRKPPPTRSAVFRARTAGAPGTPASKAVQ